MLVAVLGLVLQALGDTQADLREGGGGRAKYTRRPTGLSEKGGELKRQQVGRGIQASSAMWTNLFAEGTVAELRALRSLLVLQQASALLDALQSHLIAEDTSIVDAAWQVRLCTGIEGGGYGGYY